ncbi:MAG: WYL domain-containing protein [Oscillochloris sp.]|nr:WYL domain-containing protein [Oscillochloris sp.]
MSQRGGGVKRSSWLIFRRRLLVVRLLLRGPHTKEALVAAVQQDMRGEGYIGHAASAFKKDLDALKQEYGCKIRFCRSRNVYTLDDLGELALFDLPDTCLEALAFLDASFPQGAAIPEHAYIRDLLNRVDLLLPEARRQCQPGQRQKVSLRMPETAAESIDPRVIKTAKRAAELGQELRFAYRSNSPDGTISTYRVAPYEVFFHPDGHCYLDATLLEANPRDSDGHIPAAMHYRIDRIIAPSIEILPTKLPPQRIQPPTYQVRYWLHPNVARRRDVAAHLPQTQIVYQDDGSAMVSATTSNLWQARQTLLHYGSACRVLDPPELVALFQKAIREMAQLYEITC